MGIVRNPANTMRRGRVGETTYYISGGQQIARQALNGSNFGESARRSSAQQQRRVLWANLVNFYKASRGWMPKAFETKKRNQSDYNKFMQLNINTTKVALTKSEAEAGACVVSNFLVSQGSLPSIEISKLQNRWQTNIQTGSLTVSEDTTVAEFSEALINSNGNIREGMQLSFVSYQQSVDALGAPRAICRCYEVTLNLDNSTPLYASFPEFAAQILNGQLVTGTDISIGGFAYILSEQTTSGLAVSTQQIVTNNETLLQKYTATRQLELAVASYGVDSEVVLSPVGTVMQDPEAQPLYIDYITIAGVKYSRGAHLGDVRQYLGKSFQVIMSRPFEGSVSIAALNVSEDIELSTDSVSIDGRVINCRLDSSLEGSGVVRSAYVDLSTGETFRIEFDNSETGGDL